MEARAEFFFLSFFGFSNSPESKSKTLAPTGVNGTRRRRRRRRGREGGGDDHGGADSARAVRVPEPAVLPGDGRRQPLPARRQAPRGPRLLQPASREGWWQEDGAEVRQGQVLALCWGTAIRSCAAHPFSGWTSASTSNASYGSKGWGS